MRLLVCLGLLASALPSSLSTIQSLIINHAQCFLIGGWINFVRFRDLQMRKLIEVKWIEVGTYRSITFRIHINNNACNKHPLVQSHKIQDQAIKRNKTKTKQKQ